MNDQPCSVYFCGADSTGKSELVKYVSLAYKMRKVPETARSVLEEEGLRFATLRARSSTADEYQRLVFARQIAQEAATQRPFVADRGLDNIAYASEHGRCFAELVRREEVCAYVERQRGDVVFLVRPHRELRAEDGVRTLPSWEGQQRIDAKIELLLQLWDIPRVVLAESSAARREEMIDWCLQARGFVKYR
jgi:nicotinamide riboside kinase